MLELTDGEKKLNLKIKSIQNAGSSVRFCICCGGLKKEKNESEKRLTIMARSDAWRKTQKTDGHCVWNTDPFLG